MPYVSKKEREEQWITLKEAISHIKRVDCCDEATALQQLRNALADEAATARYKASVTSSSLYVIDMGSAVEPNFPRRKFWLTVPIDLQGDGYVATRRPDDWDKANPEEGWGDDIEDGDGSPISLLALDDEEPNWGPFPLFISRSSILQHWEEAPAGQSVEGSEPRAGQLAGIQHPENPGKVGRPASPAAILKAAREVYDEAGKEGPNVEDAYHLIREKLAAASKIASREPVREILKEFKDRRRPVGRRSSKK